MRTVLETVAGAKSGRFSAVLAGDVVSKKKPAPDIYLLARSRLETPPERVVVIEDMPIGLAAARGAGLRCVITRSAYTGSGDLSEAELVVSSLGEPEKPAEVLAGPSELCARGNGDTRRPRSGHLGRPERCVSDGVINVTFLLRRTCSPTLWRSSSTDASPTTVLHSLARGFAGIWCV